MEKNINEIIVNWEKEITAKQNTLYKYNELTIKELEEIISKSKIVNEFLQKFIKKTMTEDEIIKKYGEDCYTVLVSYALINNLLNEPVIVDDEAMMNTSDSEKLYWQDIKRLETFTQEKTIEYLAKYTECLKKAQESSKKEEKEKYEKKAIFYRNSIVEGNIKLVISAIKRYHPQGMQFLDLVNEGMITKEQALLKVEPRQLDQLLHPNFEETSLKCAQVVATGLAASPGAATGRIYFTAEDVIEAHKNGVQDILLVRLETSPEDIEGMNIAHGILTIRGGMTSHAAVVARGMGTCCVCGCGSLRVDEEAKVLMTPDGKKYHEGDYMSLDGSTGNVYGERIKTVEPEISGDFETFMSWADDVRTLKVRTNADTPRDALQARKFGAEGIGLCRTEHMFFEEERIFNFRRMITAETVEARKEALEKILPYQRSDFKELFKAMEIYPVTIRFLDPPLHEFLPHTDEEIRPLAESLGMTFDALKARVESLKEFNPMMGHRGCRLAVTYPEIAEMQTRAVIEAAIAVNKEGQNVVPEIMIPLVGDIKELKYVKDVVCKTADAIIEEAGVELPYKVGTMIEIPRAALTADEIAKEAEFFSFGTNDLTQMTYGFSRDDAAKFLNEYYTKNIFESDPFAHIDENGVGQLMQIAINKAKPVRPDIKLGICGEHGGDPRTVEFCHRIGLTYVSCSPYRVPLARLAAAQAAVKEKMGK